MGFSDDIDDLVKDLPNKQSTIINEPVAIKPSKKQLTKQNNSPSKTKSHLPPSMGGGPPKAQSSKYSRVASNSSIISHKTQQSRTSLNTTKINYNTISDRVASA